MSKNDRKASDVSATVEKLVWGNAGSFCSKCGIFLIIENAVIGELAHIVDRSLDGKLRNDPEEKILPLTQRSLPGNLILLCNNCHQEIDNISMVEKYTISYLRELKKSQEDWYNREVVKRQSTIYPEISNFYKEIAIKWATIGQLDRWESWTNKFDIQFVDKPHITRNDMSCFEELNEWLNQRTWPDDILVEINRAFINFTNVHNKLKNLIVNYTGPEIEPNADTNRFVLQPPSIYIREMHISVSHEEFNEHIARFTFKHKAILETILELTRAGNYICTLVRSTKVNPLFRLNEGMLRVSFGFENEFNYDNKKFIYHPFTDS